MPQWHTFFVSRFCFFISLHRRFSVGWSMLEDPRPPYLVMKFICIIFHFRRCVYFKSKKDVVIWERVLRLFCFLYSFAIYNSLRIFFDPQTYFNMYLLVFLLWYHYAITMVSTMVKTMGDIP